jgi:hypothetical protein
MNACAMESANRYSCKSKTASHSQQKALTSPRSLLSSDGPTTSYRKLDATTSFANRASSTLLPKPRTGQNSRHISRPLIATCGAKTPPYLQATMEPIPPQTPPPTQPPSSPPPKLHSRPASSSSHKHYRNHPLPHHRRAYPTAPPTLDYQQWPPLTLALVPTVGHTYTHQTWTIPVPTASIQRKVTLSRPPMKTRWAGAMQSLSHADTPEVPDADPEGRHNMWS